jgi:hypothetical protein
LPPILNDGGVKQKRNLVPNLGEGSPSRIRSLVRLGERHEDRPKGGEEGGNDEAQQGAPLWEGKDRRGQGEGPR